MLKDLWGFIKPYSKRFWIGTLLRASNDIIYLFVPYIISRIITIAAAQPGIGDLRQLIILMAIALLFSVYHYAGRDLAKYFIYPIAEKAEVDSKLAALKHMYALDSAWHSRENSGNKMKRLETGGNGINKIIRVYVDLVIESTVNIFFITAVFGALNWKLNFMFLVFFPTYFLLSSALTKKASTQLRIVNIEWEKFDGFSFETLNNISTIKSLGIAKNIMPYLENLGRKLYEGMRICVKYFRIREGILGVYQGLFGLAMVFFSVLEVIQGRFEIGVIALVMLYFNKIESSAREYSDTYHEFILAKIGLMRLKEILDEKPIMEDQGDKMFKRNWKILTLENIGFAYHGKNVLNDLTLEIKRGEKIGIVGISGTGKSTLFKLLLKLYSPSGGKILFDLTDLREIKRKSYIANVAVVPQETELFNLSLRDNITIAGAPGINRAEQEKFFNTAVKTAHVDDFIPKLPEGADSLIGEKGIKLSGGERQRVGLARAIFKQPDILLLDEATSHLDSESEEKIRAALEKFFENITAVVIAHRLSTIKKMDRIFVIQRGAVAEAGSFDELLEKKGEFWKLWQRQKF